MIELLGLGLAAFAAYLIFPRAPQRFARRDLPYYRRLADEMRQNEIHHFE